MFDQLLGAITLKDVVIPLFTAFVGAAGHHYAVRTTKQVAEDATAERSKEVDKQAEVKLMDSFVQRELAQSENLTHRFKLLMDGYEHQITTLTAEVQTLRREVAKLREDYGHHRIFCATCPHYQSTLDDAAD